MITSVVTRRMAMMIGGLAVCAAALFTPEPAAAVSFPVPSGPIYTLLVP